MDLATKSFVCNADVRENDGLRIRIIETGTKTMTTKNQELADGALLRVWIGKGGILKIEGRLAEEVDGFGFAGAVLPALIRLHKAARRQFGEFIPK